MLNEAPKKPKKKKDYSNPTKGLLFWRIQKESLRRAVTPMLMYLFMSLLLLASQTIDPDGVNVIEIVLGLLCVAGDAFFNGHLCFHYGKLHYGVYVAGNIHRKNRKLGIESGGDHHLEREYRPWKGFLIGLYVGLPAIVLGIIAGSIEVSVAWGYIQYFFAMFVGWAIIPLTWFGTIEGGGLVASPYWAVLMALLPILVSAIFYIIGAYAEKRSREALSAREKAVGEIAKKAKEKNNTRQVIYRDKKDNDK